MIRNSEETKRFLLVLFSFVERIYCNIFDFAIDILRMLNGIKGQAVQYVKNRVARIDDLKLLSVRGIKSYSYLDRGGSSGSKRTDVMKTKKSIGHLSSGLAGIPKSPDRSFLLTSSICSCTVSKRVKRRAKSPTVRKPSYNSDTSNFYFPTKLNKFQYFCNEISLDRHFLQTTS